MRSKLIKRFLTVIVFMIASALAFSIEWKDIFRLPELLILIFGTSLFYIAGNGVKKGAFRLSGFGDNALFTGCFETLILIMGSIDISDNVLDTRIFDIASNIRPLAYGFCIWLICRDETRGEKGKNASEGSKPTLEEYYEAFRERGLTNREVEISILAVQGMTNAEIAYELGIAESTVKKHMSNIFEKLNISARVELKNIVSPRNS